MIWMIHALAVLAIVVVALMLPWLFALSMGVRWWHVTGAVVTLAVVAFFTEKPRRPAP